jgi:hypothetical protein
VDLHTVKKDALVSIAITVTYIIRYMLAHETHYFVVHDKALPRSIEEKNNQAV